MAYGPCARRRKMLAEAAKAEGLKGIAKAIPSVVKDTVKNPPKLGKKPDA